MKKCDCGEGTKVIVEPHRFTEGGLRDVVLHGVEKRVCPNCGNESHVYPAMSPLLEELTYVFLSYERMLPQHLRFIRRYFGLEPSELAENLDVLEESVRAAENGEGPIESHLAEKLWAWAHTKKRHYPRGYRWSIIRTPDGIVGRYKGHQPSS